MVGLIFLLHFGIFSLLALGWQTLGVRAEPLMCLPALSDSLSDFWGKRWNSAFRDLSFNLLFRPLRQWVGSRWAMMLTFLISGLIHDLVISVPAEGGYGLPTLYFVIQGAGVLLEHSTLKGWIRRRGSWRGRLLTLLVVTAPVPLLFHPAFVLRVIIPFMQLIKAL